MGAPVPTDHIAKPKAKVKTGIDSQAAAMDPEIFFAIGQALSKISQSDPKFFYGVIHLLLYCVCMRVRHCCRSVLTRLGSNLLTGVCLRGKKRGGWEWRCPRYSPAGLDVGGIVWKSYQEYAKQQRLTSALVGAFVHPVGGGPPRVLGCTRRVPTFPQGGSR